MEYKYSDIFKPSHLSYLSAYVDGTKCSETSAYKIQTPGNYAEESIKVCIFFYFTSVYCEKLRNLVYLSFHFIQPADYNIYTYRSKCVLCQYSILEPYQRLIRVANQK
jgi:hypothetical protein